MSLRDACLAASSWLPAEGPFTPAPTEPAHDGPTTHSDQPATPPSGH
jgi:hypothetical protein